MRRSKRCDSTVSSGIAWADLLGSSLSQRAVARLCDRPGHRDSADQYRSRRGLRFTARPVVLSDRRSQKFGAPNRIFGPASSHGNVAPARFECERGGQFTARRSARCHSRTPAVWVARESWGDLRDLLRAIECELRRAGPAHSREPAAAGDDRGIHMLKSDFHKMEFELPGFVVVGAGVQPECRGGLASAARACCVLEAKAVSEAAPLIQRSQQATGG